MQYIIMVRVQLPDGTYSFLPLAHNYENRLLSWDSEKEAKEWAEFVMHEKIVTRISDMVE